MPYSPLKFITEGFVPSRPCANLKGSVWEPKEQKFDDNFWKQFRLLEIN